MWPLNKNEEDLLDELMWNDLQDILSQKRKKQEIEYASFCVKRGLKTNRSILLFCEKKH